MLKLKNHPQQLMRTHSLVIWQCNCFKAGLAIHLILQHFLRVSKGLNVESCHKITWSFACMADKEQVEKFLLMEPPAMIPTFLPVQDLNLGSYNDFRNWFTCIELNLHHRDRPQNCALFRGQGCSPWCQGHHPPGGSLMNELWGEVTCNSPTFDQPTLP